MDGQTLFFHSPFSPATAAQGEGPALLLQFILRELIKAEGRLSKGSPPQLAPFDWAWKQGSIYKVLEHASLLPLAFPELAPEAQVFLSRLHEPCLKLVALLEPFILICRTNENFLYFLLRHQRFPFIQAILDKICPEGPEKLKMVIVEQYQKRGFYPSKWII